MKLLLSSGLLAIAAVALAQDSGPIVIGAQDCTAQNPCAVTRAASSNVWVAAHSNPPGTAAAPSLPPPRDMDANGGNHFTRMYKGPEILSLEETAVDYFHHVASTDGFPGGGRPFDPGNVLWDRGDELTDAEAAEVLEVARHAASMENQTEAARFETEHRRMCEELNQAGTPDARVAVLQNSAARSVAQKKADGKALLEQLSPGAREHLNGVLIRQRAGIDISRQDWGAVARVQPEALEMLQAQMCAR